MPDKTDQNQNSDSIIPEVISTRELLKLAKISRSTLYDWVKKGKIYPLRHLKQNDRLFLKSDVIKLISGK